jgi:hypothetical protein
VVEHLIALVPGQRSAQPSRQRAEYANQGVTDGLGGVISRNRYQDCGSELAFDEGHDRRTLPGSDDQIAFPVPGLPSRLDRRRPLMDRPHLRGLFERAITASSAPAAVTIGASGAQILGAHRNNQAAVDSVVDRLVAHVPFGSSWVATSQPSTDLARRPVCAELASDHLAQLGVNHESPRATAASTLVGSVVREPRLVPTVRLAVAGDLSIHALIRLTDPRRDLLHRLATGQPVGYLDPIILRQVTPADRGLDEVHAASVDEPQRPTARRHADGK